MIFSGLGLLVATYMKSSQGNMNPSGLRVSTELQACNGTLASRLESALSLAAESCPLGMQLCGPLITAASCTASASTRRPLSSASLPRQPDHSLPANSLEASEFVLFIVYTYGLTSNLSVFYTTSCLVEKEVSSMDLESLIDRNIIMLQPGGDLGQHMWKLTQP